MPLPGQGKEEFQLVDQYDSLRLLAFLLSANR
jgi:hypothetical protein